MLRETHIPCTEPTAKSIDLYVRMLAPPRANLHQNVKWHSTQITELVDLKTTVYNALEPDSRIDKDRDGGRIRT